MPEILSPVEPAESEERAQASPQPANGRGRLPFLICEAALLAWVMKQAVVVAIGIAQRVGAPYQFDYGEGNVLATLVRVAHGLSLYPDPRAFPNAIDPYGPVAYYLLAIPVKLFGTSFVGPRLVVVASVAAICVLLALTLRELGGSAPAATAFGLMYATVAVVEGWSTQLRVDLPGIALTVAGLYAFCRAERAAQRDGQWPLRRLLWPVALFVAGIYCKYTLLAAPAACGIDLLMHRRWHDAWRFALLGMAMCAVVMGLAVMVTRGRVIAHMFYTHPDPYFFQLYWLRMKTVAGLHLALLAVAAIGLALGLGRRTVPLPVWWLGLATISAMTAGKMGSSSNHFLEWPAAACLAAGAGWMAITRMPTRWLAVGFTLGATVWVAAQMQQQWGLSFTPFAEVQECGSAYAYIRQQPGDRVLSENVGALLLGGKTVWVLDPWAYTQYVGSQGGPDPLEEKLRAGWFNLLVTKFDYTASPYYSEHGGLRFTPRMVQDMTRNYRRVRTFQCLDAGYVFVPVR